MEKCEGSRKLGNLEQIENFAEIVGALTCHTVAWYNDGQGPSVIYNYLTGVNIAKKKYVFT